MANRQSNLDYVIGLYNGHSAIAERVDDWLDKIHIITPIDKKIEEWVTKGYDIVLTGNPGDGKTHLINKLEYDSKLSSAYLEKDASQKTADEILEGWSKNKQAKKPFVLAINHAPLRKLAEKAKKYPQLSDLQEILISEINNNFIVYNVEREQPLSSPVVIDLSQRELLTPQIIEELIKRLRSFLGTEPCKVCPPRRCPVDYNLVALSETEEIRNDLIETLKLVAQWGFHATMRDLIGLLAYIITGGITCEQRWEGQINENGEQESPKWDDYAYYNLLYHGRSKLFDAIRATFDPGKYADPKTDLELWTGQIKDNWLINSSETLSYKPSTMQELCSLKRRYFFEHRHDTEALLKRILSDTEREFKELVSDESDDYENVEKLVEMINLLYAPVNLSNRQNQGYRYRLRLWNKHRYSVGQVPGYVAMRSIPSDRLAIYRPQLNPKYGYALEIHKDHILLAVEGWQTENPALRIDWEMYQALASARHGRIIDVQPFHILRRLDLFLRRLGSEVGQKTYSVETVEWGNHRKRQVTTIRIDRQKKCYKVS